MNNSTPLLYLVVSLHLYDAAYLFHESLPVFSNTVSLFLLQFLQDSSISLISLPSLNVSLAFHFLHQVQCLCPQLHDSSHFSSSLSLFPSLYYSHAMQLLLQMAAPQPLCSPFYITVIFYPWCHLYPKHPSRSCLLGIFPKSTKTRQGGS